MHLMQASRQQFLRPQYFSRLAVTFVLCFIGGKVGLSVPFTSGNVSPIWPPAGIALAAVLLWGYRMWPSIALASFLVNFLTPIPRWPTLAIALGSTSSALVGAYLLRRFTEFKPSLVRLRDVLGLVTLPAFVGTTLAASAGVTSLFLAGVQPWSNFGSAWLVWWLGDAIGVLIIAPLLLAGGQLGKSVTGFRWIELLTLSIGLVVTCLAIFGGRMGLAIRDDVLAFVIFPFVIWAAIRFGIAGSTVASFLTAAIAVWGTAQGHGPFIERNALHNAALLQFFIAVTSITGLILAAVVTERRHIREAFRDKERALTALKQAQYSLQEAHDYLETRIGERTAELAESNLALQAEINERIQTQEALERQTLKLKEQSDLLDLATDAILIRSLDGTISYWNKGAERLYGWTKQEAVTQGLGKLLQTKFPVPFEEIKLTLFHEGSWEGELVHKTRNGRRITVASRWTLWRDQNGTPVGWLQINTDITDRKRAEEDLRELSGRLLSLQDEERRRIARELHDGTGQNLVALQMNLALIQQRAKELDSNASQMLSQCIRLTEQVLEEMRTVSYLLHPPLLDEVGLDFALQWYVDGFKARSKINVDLNLSPQVGRLSRDFEMAVFRIVQECLTNIHRHSGSSIAKIQISRDANQVTLTVADQGRGMPSEILTAGTGKMPVMLGVGIRGMRERVTQLGGNMRIHSSDSGTVVEVVLPVVEKEILNATQHAADVGIASGTGKKPRHD